MADQKDFSYYQVYLQAGIGQLQDYLLSDELFWPLGIQGYLNLTLGGLLYYQRCAHALVVTASEQRLYQKISSELDSSRTRWRVAWQRKATWEFQSRLRQWGQALNEIRHEAEKNVPYYHSEVRTRVILSLLIPEVGELTSADQEQYESQNVLLRTMLKTGAFIWGPELEPAFPQDEFWYLWGQP